MNPVSLSGIGYYIPEGRITNDDMLATIKAANSESLDAEALDFLLYSCKRKFEFLSITTRSAIAEGSNDTLVTMAVKAAQSALASSDTLCTDIDSVIACGISNPFREPSGACIIAHELGILETDHFDINDTCNGFLKALEIASLYITTGQYQSVLIVTVENPGELADGLGMNLTVQNVDMMDFRLSNCIIGAGAAAVVVTAQNKHRRLTHYQNAKETAHWDSSLIRIPHTSLPPTKYNIPIDGFWVDGRAMAGELISANPAFVAAALSGWGIDKKSISHVVLHQLGANITFAILDKLGIPHNRAPVNTFSECGNMGSVNIPANLAIAQQQGLLTAGERLLLINSACGYTHAAAIIEW